MWGIMRYLALSHVTVDDIRGTLNHDDVIKWKHFPRYWPFVRGIYRSPVNSPHKGQWCGALMFSLIWAWTNDWVSNREAGYLRRHRAQYDVIVMIMNIYQKSISFFFLWNFTVLVYLLNDNDLKIKVISVLHYWPFVMGIKRWQADSPHKGSVMPSR